MKSKTVIMIIPLLFLAYGLSGQTIHYDYDDSGNRVRRYIIPLKSATVSDMDSLNHTGSTTKKEEFEDKLGETTIRIYPNPTRGELKVEISGVDETVAYWLFSRTGHLLEVKRQTSSQFTIDLSRDPSGMYILRLLINGKKSEWKILKE
jgi:hypothetical protein